MYTPEAFKCVDTNQIHAFIKNNSFGQLITQGESTPYVTHLPFILNPNTNTLQGHMAKANPHWKEFENNQNTLCIFTGPHHYISPAWYVEKDNVPTWDYVAVHVHGQVELIQDTNTLDDLLRQTTLNAEHANGTSWNYETITDYKKHLMNALIGFTIKIDSLETTIKMSQNRSKTDQEEVIKGLKAQGTDQAEASAALIQEFKKK